MEHTRPVSNHSGINIRTEFSFDASDPVLASILEDIAEESVNIAGYFSNKSIVNTNFVRLVPGTAEEENRRDLRVVRNTLQAHKVNYKMQKVISISPDRLPPGIPGGYSNIFNSLWCRVRILSFYSGEGEYIYLNVSNIKKAIETLSKENMKPCDHKP